VKSLQELYEVKAQAVMAMRRAGIERGVRNLLTQLYPDNAHFIYELLQNAEDAGATQVIFELQPEKLVCKHNGRPFTMDDVESITSIGETSKTDDPTAIGKFGVGFKAVFSYSSTPEIRSGKFAFAIQDLIVPTLLRHEPSTTWTEFTFPFDNPSKPPAQAFAEIRRGLVELDGNTLLFLTSVRSMMYVIPGEPEGLIERQTLDDDRILISYKGPVSSGTELWLRLAGRTTVEEAGVATAVPIAAAFRLQPLASGDLPSDQLAGEVPDFATYRVSALEDADARVAIFFPAVKERSGLRFHIHSAFASTVARDSIRDTPENSVLVREIGALIAGQLPHLLDRGLLDDGMLGALPNRNDILHVRYAPIRDAILEAFQVSPLVPVHGGRERAIAADLVTSPPSFRRALTAADLIVLTSLDLGPRNVPYRWVADRAARAGQLLRSLDIQAYGWPELEAVLDLISDQSVGLDEPRPVTATQADGELRDWLAWLESKSDKQLRRIYAFLGEACDEQGWSIQLDSIPVIRVEESGQVRHVVGSSTYLPASPRDTAANRVSASMAVYPNDPTDKETNWLRSFYDAAGVKVWNETTRVLQRLAEYIPGRFPDRAHNIRDVALFRDFVASDPTNASKFGGTAFLMGESATGRTHWVRPEHVFLDSPYDATGLSAVYHQQDTVSLVKYRLAADYQDAVVGIQEFARAVGCVDRLAITPIGPWQNPGFVSAWRYEGRETTQGPKRDWDLLHFDVAVALGNEHLLRSIWDIVATTSKDRGWAIYQRNGSSEAHWMRSTLVHRLETTAWILDLDGNLRVPRSISMAELSHGMRVPRDDSLIQALGFGRDAAAEETERVVRDRAAVEAGFPSGEAMQRVGAMFASMDSNEASALLAQIERLSDGWDVARSPTADPLRRIETARDLAQDAAARTYETRERSVAVDSATNIVRAKAYLRGHYMRSDGRLACQACHRSMPFKVNEEDYFEAVQFLRTLPTVHHQNRLALCPLCAAKYKHAKHTVDGDLEAQLLSLSITSEEAPTTAWFELSVILAGDVHNLRFAIKHALEMKGVLESHTRRTG
jgi:hypothetical protein